MSTFVSIIITAHNYARYLPQALESALNQNYDNFEVVVVDDGSTDDTPRILKEYAEKYDNMKSIRTEGLGLAAASNKGIKKSSGEYLIRLDADDYFDPNMLIVEANYLDKHRDVGLVFCDYYTVNIHGEVIQNIRRSKLDDEVELLDRPALAAGAMYRRTCYDEIGGYNEELRYQEDYDFWIKFIEKFKVRNVSLPLMYYRQHSRSMSRNWHNRMQARRLVKQRFVDEHRTIDPEKILAVIPARADTINEIPLPLLEFDNRTLLSHCVDKLLGVDSIGRVIVSTEHPDVASEAQRAGAEVPFLRAEETTSARISFESVLHELLERLGSHENYQPEIIVIAHPHSPFITSEHVDEAILSLKIFDADSIVAVLEDLSYHWKTGCNGLEPVGYKRRVIREDKDLVFKEAGGLYVIKASNLARNNRDIFGKRIGNIELSRYEAFRIFNESDHHVSAMIREKCLK